MPHVVEKFADDRTGPGVESMAVDSQVELDPAGLQSELHWGVQGSEVQLLFIYLVSSEREGRDFLSRGNRNRGTCQSALFRLSVHSFKESMKYLTCTRLDAVPRIPQGATQPHALFVL